MFLKCCINLFATSVTPEMSRFLAVLVLSAALCGISECSTNSNYIRVLQTIGNANGYISQNKLDKVFANDLDFDLGVISVETTNGWYGIFSSLIPHGQLYVNETTKDNITVTNFDINVSLLKLQFDYDLLYRYLYFFSVQGHVVISVTNNSARLVGSVTKNPDGTCKSALESYEIANMSGFKVNITPFHLYNLMFTTYSSFIYNVFFPRMDSLFTNYLEGVIKTKEFQDGFSAIVCKSLV